MNDLRVNIIGSLNDLEGMRGLWNNLLVQSGSDTIFLTWEWIYSWAESFLNGRRGLFILLVYKKAELVGIAPWYINRFYIGPFDIRQVEFLGTPEGGSDYLNVIIKRKLEREVTLCIYDFLFREVSSLWDTIMFRDIPSDSLFLLHFIELMEEKGRLIQFTPGAYCPSLSLSGGEEKVFSSLSTNRRQQFRRHKRLLESSGKLEHASFLSNSDDMESAIDYFFDIYRKIRYEERLEGFLKKLVFRCRERDWVEIDLLSSDSRHIAGLFHLRYNNTISMYLMAVDRTFRPNVSIGNVILGLCIEKAIQNDFSTYDFLKGTEPYKFHWAEGGRMSLNLSFCRRGFGPLMITFGRFLKDIAKFILR